MIKSQANRTDWIAQALFPFNAYVVIDFSFLKLFSYFTWHAVPTHFNTGHTTLAISIGYVISIGALLVGALLQMAVRQRGAKRSLVLAGLGLVFLRLLAPWGLVIL